MSYNGYGPASHSAFAPAGSEVATPAAEKVRRHPKYYLNGGDVHFLVRSRCSIAVARDLQGTDPDARRRCDRSRATSSACTGTSSSGNRHSSARSWARRRRRVKHPRARRT